MKSLFLSMIIGVATLFASSAHAERLSIDMYGRQFGPGQAIAIQQELQRAYPRIDIRNYELVSANVEIKSWDLRGDVTLRVGRDYSPRRVVNSNPRDWNDPSPRSYDYISFFNPSREMYGPWDLIMNGTRFKVGRIDVELRFLRPPPRPNPRPEPRPPRPDRFVDIQCSSQNYQVANCLVNFQVGRVTLLQQYSDGRGQCIADRTFFAIRDGVQVNGGCRGLFRVFER
ncbi:MAG TPA: hypothetical protein VM432_00025 [Bdellovibrionales bacterium]|nr:hypothetical protein [Bdellovibrionales bacterium]